METNLLMVAQKAAETALSASSSAQLNTVVVAVFGFLGILVTTIGTILLAKINLNSKGTKEASEASAKSSRENGEKVDDLKVTTLQIHGMVNKPFGVALDTAAFAMETVAEMTGRDDHKQAALTARQVSREHQAAMDAFDMAERVRETTRAERILLPTSKDRVETLKAAEATVEAAEATVDRVTAHMKAAEKSTDPAVSKADIAATEKATKDSAKGVALVAKAVKSKEDVF